MLLSELQIMYMGFEIAHMHSGSGVHKLSLSYIGSYPHIIYQHWSLDLTMTYGQS